MLTLSTIPAVAFTILTIYVNYRFGEILGNVIADPYEKAFWIAAGVTAAISAAILPGVAISHARAGLYGRAAATTLMALIGLGYDVLAGYAVSRHQQAMAADRLAQAGALSRTASEARQRAAALSEAPPTAVARAVVLTLAVSLGDCATVAGINGLPRADAERIRLACARYADAARDLAQAEARDAAIDAAGAADAAAVAARTAAHDPRLELIGEAGAASWHRLRRARHRS
jgi:hypothetical protein